MDKLTLTIFIIEGKKIPLLAEKPIKSLWRQHTAELSDKKKMVRTVKKQLSEGLEKIDLRELPGKYKV